MLDDESGSEDDESGSVLDDSGFTVGSVDDDDDDESALIELTVGSVFVGFVALGSVSELELPELSALPVFWVVSSDGQPVENTVGNRTRPAEERRKVTAERRMRGDSSKAPR